MIHCSCLGGWSWSVTFRKCVGITEIATVTACLAIQWFKRLKNAIMMIPLFERKQYTEHGKHFKMVLNSGICTRAIRSWPQNFGSPLHWLPLFLLKCTSAGCSWYTGWRKNKPEIGKCRPPPRQIQSGSRVQIHTLMTYEIWWDFSMHLYIYDKIFTEIWSGFSEIWKMPSQCRRIRRKNSGSGSLSPHRTLVKFSQRSYDCPQTSA